MPGGKVVHETQTRNSLENRILVPLRVSRQGDKCPMASVMFLFGAEKAKERSCEDTSLAQSSTKRTKVKENSNTALKTHRSILFIVSVASLPTARQSQRDPTGTDLVSTWQS